MGALRAAGPRARSPPPVRVRMCRVRSSTTSSSTRSPRRREHPAAGAVPPSAAPDRLRSVRPARWPDRRTRHRPPEWPLDPPVPRRDLVAVHLDLNPHGPSSVTIFSSRGPDGGRATVHASAVLREEIESWPRRPGAEAGQTAEVARESGGIAGGVNQSSGGGGPSASDTRGVHSGAGRIGDGHIRAAKPARRYSARAACPGRRAPVTGLRLMRAVYSTLSTFAPARRASRGSPRSRHKGPHPCVREAPSSSPRTHPVAEAGMNVRTRWRGKASTGARHGARHAMAGLPPRGGRPARPGELGGERPVPPSRPTVPVALKEHVEPGERSPAQPTGRERESRQQRAQAAERPATAP